MGPKYVFNVIQKYIDCEMFNNDNILIQSLKFFIKHLIWNFKFHKYNKSRRNIFLLTSRRSGGTWIMQALSRIKNTKSVIERFLNDPKEVAEHNMLVDLERNDLSCICKPGTVRLTRFREVETYAHLHHLVSTIEGELKEKISLSDILSAMLPGGSITGCPKIRTMQLIDQLETYHDKLEYIFEKFMETETGDYFSELEIEHSQREFSYKKSIRIIKDIEN